MMPNLLEVRCTQSQQFLKSYSCLSTDQHPHRHLCNLVSVTSLGEILLSVEDGRECEELYRRYLHDFVRSVHKCTHKTEETVKQEYQVNVYCYSYIIIILFMNSLFKIVFIT